jgi:hypothetical protein
VIHRCAMVGSTASADNLVQNSLKIPEWVARSKRRYSESLPVPATAAVPGTSRPQERQNTVMSNPNRNKRASLTDPNPLRRYFYSGSRQGIVFVMPNTEEMQNGVFGGSFKQCWRFAQEIDEYTQSQIPSYPVQEPEPGQPARPEPEPQPQRQPAVPPTPRRTAVAEPETETKHETDTTKDAAQEIARLKHYEQVQGRALLTAMRCHLPSAYTGSRRDSRAESIPWRATPWRRG